MLIGPMVLLLALLNGWKAGRLWFIHHYPNTVNMLPGSAELYSAHEYLFYPLACNV